VRARYARERYQLYKARAMGPRATSPARLRELQQACEQAQARLRFAEAEAEAEGEGDGEGVGEGRGARRRGGRPPDPPSAPRP
jgi:hypothetical protein